MTEDLANTLTGVVVFRKVNVGSKSEGCFPFLQTEDGELVRLAKTGDDSFEQLSLLPFDGKQVTVVGTTNEFDVFCVQEINEIQGE